MKKISVVITSYAHEKYIAQCIESVVRQKDVEFDIVVGDDCSPDRTKDIISEYAKKYPNLITVLPRPSNLGMLKNMKDCFEHCTGEYVSICEGDDYWTDEYRLKKMAEVLDKNTDASFCFTDIALLLEDKGKIVPHMPRVKANLGEKISFRDLVKYANPVANFSCCMYRKSCLEKLPSSYFLDRDNADYLLNMYMLDFGSGLFLKDVCSVYRILKSGQWARRTPEQQKRGVLALNAKYNDLFDGRYEDVFLEKRKIPQIPCSYMCKKWRLCLLSIHQKNNITKVKLFGCLTLLTLKDKEDSIVCSLFKIFNF